MEILKFLRGFWNLKKKLQNLRSKIIFKMAILLF